MLLPIRLPCCATGSKQSASNSSRPAAGAGAGGRMGLKHRQARPRPARCTLCQRSQAGCSPGGVRVHRICLRAVSGACMIVTPTVRPLMLPLGLPSPACHGVQPGQRRSQGRPGAPAPAAGAGPAGAQPAPCQLWPIIFAGRCRLAPLRPLMPAYAQHSGSTSYSQR